MRSLKWRMVTGVGVLVTVLSCQARHSSSINQNLASVISVDDSVVVTPGPYAGATSDGLEQAAPGSVAITPSVTRSSSGTGFIFQMSWTFLGASPTYWMVNFYSDDNAGSEPTRYQGTGIIQPGGSLQYQSGTLASNRMYKFELVAFVSSQGEVTFKKVTVNLTGVE